MDFIAMVVMFMSGAVAGWLAQVGKIKLLKAEHRRECEAMIDIINQRNRSIRSLSGWIKRSQKTAERI